MKYFFIALTVFILAGAGNIFAQQADESSSTSTGAQATPPAGSVPHRGMGNWLPMISEKLTTELNLTADQQAKLKTLIDNFQGNSKSVNATAPKRDPLSAMLSNVSNLTEDQKNRLTAIFNASKEWMQQHKPIFADHIKATVEEFKKDQMDVAKLDAMAKSTQKSREDARIFMRNTLEQVHSVLTPEQRVQVAEKIGNVMGRFVNPPSPTQE